MHVVMAPDGFRGALTAPEAAEAMRQGWLRHAPGDTVTAVPMSDGGPGFVEAVRAALAGSLVPVTVTGPSGPHGPAVPAAILLVPAESDPSGRSSAYLELSDALGGHLLTQPAAGSAAAGPPAPVPVLERTSRGAGELLAAALGTHASRVVVGAGRAAVLDGGSGLLEGLAGAASVGEPAGLARAARLGAEELPDLAGLRRRLVDVELVLASDLDPPLVGRHGPVQAGGRDLGVAASEQQAADAAMTAWAATLVEAATAAGVPDPGRLVALPGAGCAGGAGAVLLALGAVRRPGAAVVAAAAGLEQAVAGADLVLTGEGAFDWDSLRGRVVGAVCDAAARHGVPVVVVAGQVLVGRRELAAVGVEAAYPVAASAREVPGCLADPAGTLAARTARVARTWHR